MRVILKALKFFAMTIVSIFILAFLYWNFAFPKVGPPEDIKVSATPEKLERGRYLVNHVAVCVDCHGTRDWTKYSGPVISGTEGKGGERFDESMGLPGVIYSRNITPAGIGKWTDGEVLRAFTTGVNKDGKALFPLMPYDHFGKISREDAESILVYIRSLPPIEFEVPNHIIHFPMNIILPTIPAPAQFASNVDKNNSVEYGRYLVNMAGCETCHTQAEHGKPLPGMEFAGGRAFPVRGGIAHSANITPDNETGIGIIEKADFIDSFKSFKVKDVAEGEKNTIMPRSMYSGMTNEDLGAIYDYLRTLKPVRNKVETFTRAM